MTASSNHDWTNRSLQSHPPLALPSPHLIALPVSTRKGTRAWKRKTKIPHQRSTTQTVYARRPTLRPAPPRPAPPKIKVKINSPPPTWPNASIQSRRSARNCDCCYCRGNARRRPRCARNRRTRRGNGTPVAICLVIVFFCARDFVFSRYSRWGKKSMYMVEKLWMGRWRGGERCGWTNEGRGGGAG